MHTPVDPRTTLLRSLRDEVRQNNRAGHVALAIDGVKDAGMKTFADAFADVLAADGSAVFRASIDDFRRPPADGAGHGTTSPAEYYRDSYDYALFRRVLIEPFRAAARNGESAGFQLSALGDELESGLDSPTMTAPKDAVLIVDGTFLNRPELRGVWNWSLWLDGPTAVASVPILALDGAQAVAEADAHAQAIARNLEAHQLYLWEARPLTAASVIVDNTDPANPARVYRDFC